MTIEIKVPPLGESVTEASIAKWMKQVGDAISIDENLVELETDKATLDVPSPVTGKIVSLAASEGETLGAGAVLAVVEEGGKGAATKPAKPAPADTKTKANGAAGTGKIIEVKVPALGESVNEASVAKWMKQAGETIAADENLAELETDKATLDVPAPTAGKIISLAVKEGESVTVGSVLAKIEAGASAPSVSAPSPAPASSPQNTPQGIAQGIAQGVALSPAVRRLVEEHNLDPNRIPASGKDGRLTKGDVLAAMENKSTSGNTSPSPAVLPSTTPSGGEERVAMSRLRQVIATRLKEAQNTAAILTTFNEVDMSAVIETRQTYREAFEKRHKVRLGFMGFFVKAAIAALQEFPAVNAEIRGSDIVYKNYYNIGVAVSAPQGLVVPVLKGADAMSLAEIEKAITHYATLARDGKLGMADMSGGTFTISNGGIYGSMLSTPILNPPQSAILGMHNIQKRAVVVGDTDTIQVKPMMYLAVSYDHRIIDGREAVSFLVRIKQALEDPRRLLLGL